MSASSSGPYRRPAAGDRPAGHAGHSTLSGVLLLTMLALLVAIAARASNVAERIRAASPGAAVDELMPDTVGDPSIVKLSGAAGGLAIEPAAGPDVMPLPGSASRSAAAAPTCRLEAVEAIAGELGRREVEIDARAQAIVLREAAMAPVEERVREQVARLEKLKGELETLLGEASRDEEARIAHLVKVYEAMKARSAAGIFETIALDLLLPIVTRMRDTKVAAVVAEMAPDKARVLTAALAKRQELPTLR
jgi:flagellar motility protein MotE (MotC chaperone)